MNKLNSSSLFEIKVGGLKIRKLKLKCRKNIYCATTGKNAFELLYCILCTLLCDPSSQGLLFQVLFLSHFSSIMELKMSYMGSSNPGAEETFPNTQAAVHALHLILGGQSRRPSQCTGTFVPLPPDCVATVLALVCWAPRLC